MLSKFNVSMVSKPPATSSLNGLVKIDECLLSLQRNESDVIMFPYAMVGFLPNIETGPVAYEATIGMLSAYNFESNDNKPGIFGTFQAFSSNVLLIIGFIFLFHALMTNVYSLENTGRRYRVRGNRSTWRFIFSIFSFFVKQFSSWPGKETLVKKLIICCLLAFSFFSTFFYTSMSRTDMITVKSPHVFASYQKILDDAQVKPYIFHVMDEYRTFKFAPNGSVKKRIWELIARNGIEKYVLETNNIEDVARAEADLRNMKGVFIAFSNALHSFKYFGKLRVKGTKLRFLISFDPSEQSIISTFVMNTSMDRKVSRLLRRRLTHVHEADLFDKMGNDFSKNFAMEIGSFIGYGQDISNAESFVSERILLPRAVLIAPHAAYFSSLFILYFVLIFISFLIWICERYSRPGYHESVSDNVRKMNTSNPTIIVSSPEEQQNKRILKQKDEKREPQSMKSLKHKVQIHSEPSIFIAKHNDGLHDQRKHESIAMKHKQRGSSPKSWTVVVEIQEGSSTQIHTCPEAGNGREGTLQTQKPRQLRKSFRTATAIDFTRKVKIHTDTTIIAE